ncbi:MAG: triose-phosphate isomerase [Synergistales bacterium]|nr:triose-phosphate isomerase [Synergistales bacterium]
MEPRRMHISGNWKMNLGPRQSKGYLDELKGQFAALSFDQESFESRGVDVSLFPPFTSLHVFSESARDMPVVYGAQNAYCEASGAYTGEISADMVKELGARQVLVGHSERRHIFAESTDLIARKVSRVLSADLQVMLCVGETLEERQKGDTFDVLEKQVLTAIAHQTPEEVASWIQIAYEPVWAIGTGRNASPEDAQEACQFIRRLIAERFGHRVAPKTRILYGGSVKPGNAQAILERPDVDGALIGGASLKADTFAEVIRIAMEIA